MLLRMKKGKGGFWFLAGVLCLVLSAEGAYWYKTSSRYALIRVNLAYDIGEQVDSFNGVPVYFNDHVGNVIGSGIWQRTVIIPGSNINAWNL